MKALILLICMAMMAGCTVSRDYYGADISTGTLAWAQMYESGETVLNMRTRSGEITEQKIDVSGSMKDPMLVCRVDKKIFILQAREALPPEFDEYKFERKFYKHKIRSTGPYDAFFRSPYSSAPDPFTD